MHEYTDIVKDHFQNPRNIGEILDPDGEGEAVSPACGDMAKLTIRTDNKGFITDAKCKVAGCVSTIAVMSALTEMLKGLSIEEAASLKSMNIIDYLGGLPTTKRHAAAIGQEVLENAVADYYTTKKCCSPSISAEK
ncbi:MAG TPA: iron-sulfur cluster assembly scaffold protein [Syntrophorhabdaceae bacterium]|nr:iron-sulfur cluster assembly scaffold protein [Syntrophorhabdaceae bacterium]